MKAGRGLEHRFIVDNVSMTFESAPMAVYGFEGSSQVFQGPIITRMDLGLIFHDTKALADFARIPEFTEMLHREMNRLGLCRYCGCQLPDDDKPNCSQCGGPRTDKT